MTEPNTVFYQNLLRLQSKQTPKRTYSQQVCYEKFKYSTYSVKYKLRIKGQDDLNM